MLRTGSGSIYYSNSKHWKLKTIHTTLQLFLCSTRFIYLRFYFFYPTLHSWIFYLYLLALFNVFFPPWNTIILSKSFKRFLTCGYYIVNFFFVLLACRWLCDNNYAKIFNFCLYVFYLSNNLKRTKITQFEILGLIAMCLICVSIYLV